jgi:hypothetical protein
MNGNMSLPKQRISRWDVFAKVYRAIRVVGNKAAGIASAYFAIKSLPVTQKIC